MPLSARSPTGVVSLVGLDQLTLENLRARNRKEKLFTARCCGAPVQIRTPAGKIAHFYHLSTTPDCLGSAGESQTHLALKAQIAVAAMEAGWEVEVEAEERREDGTLVWKADVLARRGNAKIAFEVQISNADWTSMNERQERYRRSGVRGLWFVKTKKPFPAQKGLPIFNLTLSDEAWRVSLLHPDDCAITSWAQAAWSKSPLAEFIGKALNGDLKWAPLTRIFDVTCDISVRIFCRGRCLHCMRDIGTPYTIDVAMSGRPTFPTFSWHHCMTSRRSDWPAYVLPRLKQQATDLPGVALIDHKTNTCGACGTSASRLGRGAGTKVVTLPAWLRELPAPREGTIEWHWFHRWVLQRD